MPRGNAKPNSVRQTANIPAAKKSANANDEMRGRRPDFDMIPTVSARPWNRTSAGEFCCAVIIGSAKALISGSRYAAGHYGAERFGGNHALTRSRTTDGNA